MTGKSKRQVEDGGNETHIGQSREHSHQQRDRNGTGSHWCKQWNREERASWALDRSSLWQMSWEYDVACVFQNLNYAPRQKRGEKQEEKAKEMQVLSRRMVIYLHEHVMPTAEPSGDHWDWPICTPGQRSRGRGRDNLIGRDWSLPGRHHLGGRTKAVSHPHTQENQTRQTLLI